MQRIGAMLVIVGQAIVFVERERAVGAGVNIKRDRVGRFLAGVLQFRPEGNMEPARMNSGIES